MPPFFSLTLFEKSQGYDIICLQCCANKDLLKREIFVFGEFEGVYPLKDSNYDLTNLFSQISYMVWHSLTSILSAFKGIESAKSK